MSAAHRIKVEFSMVTLKWGDALSLVLPGALALFAVSLFFKEPEWAIDQVLHVIGPTAGLALLLAAAVLGGVLEGITRISWERLILAKRFPFPSVLNKLTPENIDLYERGVQSSYKWVTFYANAATALLVLSGGLLYRGGALRWGIPIALLVAGVLFRASYIQWTYFGNYLSKVFFKENEPHAAK